MNQKNIDVINICIDAMLAFGNEKSKADIREAKEAFRGMAEQIEVLGDTVNMLSPLMMENRKLKEKQTPKPPEYIDYDTCYFKCGACSGEISWTGILEDHKYCLECGQAIDWR